MGRRRREFGLSGVVVVSAFLSAAAKDGVSITYLAGSTAKLEQLIGDYDKSRRAPTANQTFTRYRIEGTDLGYSFEHKGRVVFLFGDTLGRWGGDVVGYSNSTDPERGLHLDFLTDRGGRYLKVEPPGISMRGFEVPDSGISLNGKMYVVVKTNHSRETPTDRSVLTVYDPSRRIFTPVREISRLPDGKVIEMAMHVQPEPIADLPWHEPCVLIWSSGVYRKSDAYFSVVPLAQFESGKGTRYFAGLDSAGKPTWSEHEADAQPVVEHPTIGNLSVTWSSDLKRWLMTYDSREPRGIVFRYAANPWGPWSPIQMIFKIRRDGGQKFIHQSGADDGLDGPLIKRTRDAKTVGGGAYAPYMIERFTKSVGDKLTIYYVLSTWNPYVVVLMKSSFRVTGNK